jgi:hypothetical protein
VLLSAVFPAPELYNKLIREKDRETISTRRGEKTNITYLPSSTSKEGKLPIYRWCLWNDYGMRIIKYNKEHTAQETQYSVA